MSTSEVIELFREDIRAGAFNVAALTADETGCDWAYSVGLAPCFSHPELLIVGMEAPLAGAVIEVLGQEIADGRRIEVGRPLVVAGSLTLRAIEVGALWLSRGDWFQLGRQVMAGWGKKWSTTLQLLWSDEKGRYPERPGDPAWIMRQPMLASRPPTPSELS